MWIRGVIGILLCATGAVWIAQGTNSMNGSGMSGHGQWAVIGVVAIVIGLGLLVWASRVRKRRTARVP
jgi:hypothetical protein